jgi:predicted MPP superfamily phosphohydrolase
MNGLDGADAWLYLGLILGHGILAVCFLNLTHGIGLSPKWMTRLAVAPLVLPAIVAIAMGWLILTRPVHDWHAIPLGYAYLCALVAYVVFPVLTIYRWIRPDPAGVSVGESTVAFDLPVDEQADWIGEGKYAWMLRLSRNQSLSLHVASADVILPGLPCSFRPLRILHLSDLHFAPCYRRAFFEAVADEGASWEADLVLFTGDLLDDEATLDWAVPVLGKLRGRLGQYAILGNHDVLHRPGRVRRELRAAGFAVVDGRWVRIEDQGSTIALGGTSVPWGPTLDPSARPSSDATIVMSHSPDHFPAIARWKSVDLVLAGHNHGGQIRVPLIGPIVMPSIYGRRYDRGFYRRGSTLMEVTQGVGGKHPIRLGCPPEIVQLTIRPPSAAPGSIVEQRAALSQMVP